MGTGSDASCDSILGIKLCMVRHGIDFLVLLHAVARAGAMDERTD
jgi:hypothetical protein